MEIHDPLLATRLSYDFAQGCLEKLGHKLEDGRRCLPLVIVYPQDPRNCEFRALLEARDPEGRHFPCDWRGRALVVLEDQDNRQDCMVCTPGMR